MGVRDQDRVDQSGIEIVEGNTAVAQLNWNVGLIEVHKKSAMSKTKKTTTDERANFFRVGEQLADAPSKAQADVLFDPEGHDPISDKEMEA